VSAMIDALFLPEACLGAGSSFHALGTRLKKTLDGLTENKSTLPGDLNVYTNNPVLNSQRD